MAAISLSGLASGMDTSSIIEQLMKVEQRKLTLLNNNLNKYSDKKTAISELESKVGTFKTALGNLSSLSKLKAFNIATGDSDIVTASASSSAQEGSHSVQIKQLATAERLVHDGANFSSKSSLVGEGTFIYSYNYQEVVVATTDETTLQELVTKINGDANNPGVTASLLEYDDGTGRWHLVLAGKDTGSDNIISINDYNTELKTSQSKLTLSSGSNNATATTRIKDMVGYSDTTSVTLTATGGTPPAKNHSGGDVTMTFTVNSYSTVQDLMDAIEEAYGDTVNVSLDEGFLKVADTACNTSLTDLELSFTGGPSPLAFGTTVDGGSQEATLDNFANATFTQTQEAKDALVKVDGYPTGASNWMSRQTNSISDVIDGVTLNLQTTTETAPASGVYNSISVSLTRNTETVKENIKAMISAYNAVVSYIDDKTTYDTENKKIGVLSDSYSISTISTLITSPLRSMAGGFTSSDTFTTPTDIGLEINADGTLELDSETFDEAVSENYNAVLNLIGAQQVGSTFGDNSAYISFYGASSRTTAGSYDVEVVKDDEGKITALIKLSTEDWGDAREMTVDGNTLYGKNDQTVAGYPAYPEYSMVLTLDSSMTNGAMWATTVNVRQGFGDNLYDMVTEMLKSDGRIDLARDSITSQIGQQQDRIDKEQTRLEKHQQYLQSKYARLESALNSMQQQMATVNAMM
jgi:flagellar hook-associated protein 2